MLQKSQIPAIVRLVKPYFDLESASLSCAIDHVNRFGFFTARMNANELVLEQCLAEILDNRAIRAWTHQSHEHLKHLIREFGIPNALRPKLWLGFIQNEISEAYNVNN